jgi:MFS family permease
VGSTFSTLLNPLFGRAVPAAYRGRAFGIAVAGVSATQGLAQILAGLVAEHSAATSVIGVSGLAGLLSVLAVALIWPRRAATASPAEQGQAEAAAPVAAGGGQPGSGGTAPDSSPGPSR